MARLPRFRLPGYPQHLIQRGQGGQPILEEEADYWALWEYLAVSAERFGCQIHSYTLMPDHFHLLLTPTDGDGISRMMQHVGRYYVQYIRGRIGHAGNLWEGRYRATLLDPEAFLLPTSRYIELNAVRAGLVDAPGHYDWSRFGANAPGIEDPLIQPHPVYQALGEHPKARHQGYLATFESALDDALLKQLRESTNKAWVLGDDAFCCSIEDKLNRRARPRPRGGDHRSAAYRKRVDGAQGACRD